MAWVCKDFVCADCGAVFEELYEARDESVFIECPSCGSHDTSAVMSAPNIGAFSAASLERRQEILKKRSEKHTAKEVAKEPERWGKTGIAKAQENRKPQVGYTGK